jgi:hypothetical protein
MDPIELSRSIDMTTSEPTIGPVTITSTRNRAIGAAFLLVTALFLNAQFARDVAVATRVLTALGALIFALMGIRLLLTASVRIDTDTVAYRDKWLRRIELRRTDIRSVEMGRRTLAYQRAFPRVNLESGQSIDLVYFEQALARANEPGSSVGRIIQALNAK